jgi:hypothetical protein
MSQLCHDVSHCDIRKLFGAGPTRLAPLLPQPSTTNTTPNGTAHSVREWIPSLHPGQGPRVRVRAVSHTYENEFMREV